MTTDSTTRATGAAKSDTKLVAMTGKASPAKAAEGDGPMFAYIASLPQPQGGIVERFDALAAEQLADLRRAVKWGMAYYGVDGGLVLLVRGLRRPCGTDVHTRHRARAGMGRSTRGVEPASVDDLDERQLVSWMKQAATMPFFGAKKR